MASQVQLLLFKMQQYATLGNTLGCYSTTANIAEQQYSPLLRLSIYATLNFCAPFNNQVSILKGMARATLHNLCDFLTVIANECTK